MKKILIMVAAAVMLCSFSALADETAEAETDFVADSVLEDSPEWVSGIPEAADARQLFVVAGIGQTTAYVSMHEKAEDDACL